MTFTLPQRVHDRLGATARDLVALTANVPAVQLRRRPADRAAWSAAMVMSHLADAELVYGLRLRLILTEARPLLSAFDQNGWAERFGGLDDPRDALARWRTLREANLRVLESVEDDEWDRTGVHVQRGEMTVADVVAHLIDHDRNHLDQIRRTLAEVARRATS
jgi:hypothetical protein